MRSSRRTVRIVAGVLGVVLTLGTGGAASAASSSHWVMNIGEEAAEARIVRVVGEMLPEQEESLYVAPGQVVEVPAYRGEELQLPHERDLLVIATSSGLDPTALRITPPAADRPRSRDGLILRLRGDNPSVHVQLSDDAGKRLGYLMLSAAQPLDVAVDLDDLLDGRVDPAAVRHHAEVLSGRLVGDGAPTSSHELAVKARPGGEEPSVGSLSVGIGYFNYTINWKHTPPLYYYVTGGPPNTCGDLYATRNGLGPFVTVGWLCTDANGNATKGPWYWKDQADDETAYVYIQWPNNTKTNTSKHIWDVRPPSVAIDASCAASPPGCWSGLATDGVWGAGFDSSWALVWSQFYDTTAGLYYDSYTGTYSSTGWITYYGNFTGLPSHSAGWSVSFPPAGTHISGHIYEWRVWVWDGGQTSPPALYRFTY